ncbi:MAG: saccharopine dehydrogenase NADP-binding domain-containing protein [Candidatus Marinimicrobia bacterium]|nr:saccharopine dehydrogenase NADP-binding domain-containing protein [Candidatus Neomarinimicrobiota bacterium]MCF7840205.1 saccharopine dehydrogenase NADP-binding domain-containing protein [Candidatus Neomarinimicrobiota bacterium]
MVNHSKTIFILGGYGNTGRLIARLFLAHSPVRVLIAGRNIHSAVQFQKALNKDYSGDRVGVMSVDADDESGLVQALAGVDLLVVASSTTDHAATIARAALQAGCDYLDINLGSDKLRQLRGMENEIKAAGRCFVTEGGFHPGLPAAMIRAARQHMDSVEMAIVASVIGIEWKKLTFSPATVTEFVQELMDYQSLELVDGHWQKMRWNQSVREVDFGSDYGIRSVYPMWLPELEPLPQSIPSLREAGFYVGGFNSVVDYFFMPIAWIMLKIAPKRLSSTAGRLFLWGLRRYSKPPFGTVLLLQAAGKKAGAPVQFQLRLEHVDGYFLTAAGAAATALQILNGTGRKPGLWLQGNFVDTTRLWANLKTMGVVVTFSHPGDRN